MGLFSKKNKPQDVTENLSKMGDLKALAEQLLYMANDEVIKNRIVKIIDVIKYMPPTKKAEMIKIEEKIAYKLDDLKITLTNKSDQNKAMQYLQDLDLLLLERKNKF